MEVGRSSQDNTVMPKVILDPNDLDVSMQRLADAYSFDAEALATLRRILTLLPRSIGVYVDEANALLYENLSLADKFSFDLETDELVLFTRDLETFIDALIEMVMYLAGFATMIGIDEEWVVEFTIGAWKPVKNRIKRQLDIPVHDHPRGVVGLPASPDKIQSGDPYPFRTLVSKYDLGSFYQMVVLAARDDVAVYFPPDTHPKVLAAYVYMRRAMQEVAQGIDLTDHATFNSRLLDTIQRLQNLFNPASLTLSETRSERPSDAGNSLGLFPPVSPPKENPFEEFIEQLFPDDEPDDRI
jgi:hypothetical protein